MASNESKVVNLYANETLMQEAAEWLVKLEDGLDTSDEAKLARWKAKSSRHADVFEQMSETLADAEILSSLADVFPLQRRKTKAAWSRITGLAAAAIVCLAMLPIGYFGLAYFNNTSVSAEHSYSYSAQVDAPIATSVRKTLPDGSELTLNSNSSAFVRYSAEAREIVLVQGELHIDVMHNPDWPLSVIAGEQRFEAIGTAFNVAMNQSDVELIVTDGKVSVEVVTVPQTDQAEELSAAVSREKIVQVVKGEKLQIRVHSSQPVAVQKSPINEAQMAMSLSWREGIITFNGEPLTTVVEQLTRYTGKEFVIEDESLKGMKIVARFKMQELDDILSVMEKNMGINAYKDTNRSELIVLNSAK